MSLGTKLFGTYSDRQIKKLEKIAKQIEALAEKYAAMTDDELKAVTPALKSRLAGGETLDDILPDAFAAVREADDRVLGKHILTRLQAREFTLLPSTITLQDVTARKWAEFTALWDFQRDL